jgi:hypothetical protein
MNTEVPEKSGLLNLAEAAAYLGCPPRTLRKIVDRSRLRLKGIPVQGPTLQFFQACPRGAIQFRRKWLDDYIEAGTHRPEDAPLKTRIAPPSKSAPAAEQWPALACDHGFGPVRRFDS